MKVSNAWKAPGWVKSRHLAGGAQDAVAQLVVGGDLAPAGAISVTWSASGRL